MKAMISGARMYRQLPVEPGAHRLPDHIMWVITLTTSVGMAFLNLITVWSMRTLVKWKFRTMQTVTDEYGVLYGTLTLIGVAAFLATICMSICCIWAPDAGSSGAPENKGWLNGNPTTGFFTQRNLIGRGLATILGNAAGYPVGREGPTVTMGSNLAYLITDSLALPYARQWVDVDTSGAGRTSALMVDEERLAAAKRVACAVGGACGMCMIFDSPIGGILYMLEEMTAICWPLELTFRAFVGTVTCGMLSRGMLNLCSTDTKAFVVYEWSPQLHPWDWWDLPMFVLIACVLGPFSSVHTRMCLHVGSMRQTLMKSLETKCWRPKVLEAISYAATCATVCALVAQLGRCEPLKSGDSAELVRYNCPHGEYNPVASLLLTTSEGAVNLLFSRRNEGEIQPANLFCALCAYTCLNIGLTGVPAPSGNFTGTMLIGGLVGRILGSVSRELTGGSAVPGVYAMVGSASMLCGFKRMSMAVVWFVAISSNDFNLVPPLMLSVCISLLLSRVFKEKGFDEEQLLRRKVPFLEPEPPMWMDNMIAKDLREDLPREAILPQEAAARDVLRALECPEVDDFPVVHNGVCLGFTTRDRLRSALDFFADQERERGSGALVEAATEAELAGMGASPSRPDSAFDRLVSDTLLKSLGALPPDAKLPVQRLVDPVPYTILEEMPAVRLYALFARAGVNIACVVSDSGKFRGKISRMGIIKRTREMED